jgi:hypothetical protein
VYLAKWGLRHYGPGLGVREGREFQVVESAAELDGARRAAGRGRVIAIVTLARANRLEHPDLDAALAAGFVPTGRFPGTLGDGEVSVWEPR